MDIVEYTPSVLLPYKITLFSNSVVMFLLNLTVLLPYKITLFSNQLVEE